MNIPDFSFSFGEHIAKSWDFHAFMLGIDSDTGNLEGGLDVGNFTYCGDEMYISSLFRIMKFSDGWSLDLLYIRFLNEYALARALSHYEMPATTGWKTVLRVALFPITRFFLKDSRDEE